MFFMGTNNIHGIVQHTDWLRVRKLIKTAQKVKIKLHIYY